jgi:hypothetical protein
MQENQALPFLNSNDQPKAAAFAAFAKASVAKPAFAASRAKDRSLRQRITAI